MSNSPEVTPTLNDPFAGAGDAPEAAEGGAYEAAIEAGKELLARPLRAASDLQVARQHSKDRMTVWERLRVLSSEAPTLLFQNWGPSLDGASIVTAVLRIADRDVAVYGHDFCVRAGSMDATNGSKLARLVYLAGERGIPLIGMNDSAGAYVPAGVGGLDGYSEAFCALRKISGVVPSIMCMFGFNAGGGAYLPRQGSFIIQPANTFFGLTGPGVVKSVLGEDVSADELGGPRVHGASGVADLTTDDEVMTLRTATRLLSYLPSSNRECAPFQATNDPADRPTPEIDTLLRKTINSSTGYNTPMDVCIIIQQLCDHGDYFELQPGRARSAITALGRIGGHVVGFVANNSAVDSGQIDIASAYKMARFVRFCSIYNIPLLFLEDTTGFMPGTEQESGGIVQAGRALLDAIIDARTPRILLILRNAFGGAYAAFNSYHVGADLVLALPTTRVAVMGTAGKEFVYKDEIRALRKQGAQQYKRLLAEKMASGLSETEAKDAAQAGADAWLKQQEAVFTARYERELMNPREALSLGSISRIVMPNDLRAVITKNLNFMMRHYQPGPFTEVQREFH